MDFTAVVKPFLAGLISALILIFLIYPFVLSVTNRLINGFWPSYGRGLAVVVVAGIVANIVNYVIARVTGHGDVWLLEIVSVIVTLLVGGAVMNALVHHKDGAPLGFGRAALACLVLGIVVVLIGIGMSPWTKGWAKQIEANAPKPATATSAPALPATATASVSSALAAASTAPAAASSIPAATATVH